MNQASRLEQLREMVQQEPDDDFARYGLALELRKEGQTQQALAEFEELRRRHPDYVPGYFMAAQMLADEEREDEARSWLAEGIEAAKRTGDDHALEEMQEFMESIE